MHILLLAAMVTVAVLTPVTGSPRNLASWVIVILMMVGVYTTPSMLMRLAVVVVALLSPVVRIILRTGWLLTVHPLVHYFRDRLDAHKAFVMLVPGDALHVATAPLLDPAIHDAESLGFRSRGRLALAVERYTVVTEFLTREDGRLWATVHTAVGGPARPVVLDCMATLASGEVFTVNNYSRVIAIPPVPGFVTIRVPSLTRIADVVRACEGLAGRRGAVITPPREPDLVSMVQSETKDRLEAECQAGYRRYDARNDVYRPTLKGAYRLHWVMLPPMNGVLDRRDRERERALLAKLGIAPSHADRAEPVSLVKQYRQEAPAIALLIALAVFGPEIPTLIRALLR